MGEREGQRGGQVLEKTRQKTERPPLFRVILHNDDYTPMDFVVTLLEGLFAKSPAEAHQIMMSVHVRGSGIAGTYPHEVAETKVSTVHELAHSAGHPLRASLEPE